MGKVCGACSVVKEEFSLQHGQSSPSPKHKTHSNLKLEIEVKVWGGGKEITYFTLVNMRMCFEITGVKGTNKALLINLLKVYRCLKDFLYGDQWLVQLPCHVAYIRSSV